MNHYKTVLLSKSGRTVSALGYTDNGNFLKDKRTRKYVSITTPLLILNLFPKEIQKLITGYTKDSLHITEKTYKDMGFKTIHFSTINNPDDVMLVFEADFLILDKNALKLKPLIGISKTNFKLLGTSMCILLSNNI